MQNSYNGENPFEIILYFSILAFTYYLLLKIENSESEIEWRTHSLLLDVI